MYHQHKRYERYAGGYLKYPPHENPQQALYHGGYGPDVPSMVTTASGEITITLQGDGGDVTIDWGDGNGETQTLTAGGVDFVNDYGGAGTRLIQIYGALGNITYKKCWNANLTKILSMDGLTNLTTLYIDFNPIVDIPGVSNLTSLVSLSMSGGNLTNISALLRLLNLQYLDLTNNDFTDISVLVNLSNLNNFRLTNVAIDYPLTGLSWFTATSGTFRFNSCVDSAAEVDQMLIDFAAANWSTCTIYLDGTNPARTSASDAAVAQLVLAGVTLHLN